MADTSHVVEFVQAAMFGYIIDQAVTIDEAADWVITVGRPEMASIAESLRDDEAFRQAVIRRVGAEGQESKKHARPGRRSGGPDVVES